VAWDPAPEQVPPSSHAHTQTRVHGDDTPGHKQPAVDLWVSGKGNTSDPNSLEDTLRAGAAGFKLHEDWGTVPSSININACLTFADAHDDCHGGRSREREIVADKAEGYYVKDK